MRRFEKDSRLVLAQPFAQSEVTARPVRIEQVPRPLKRLGNRPANLLVVVAGSGYVGSDRFERTAV